MCVALNSSSSLSIALGALNSSLWLLTALSGSLAALVESRGARGERALLVHKCVTLSKGAPIL